MWDKFSEILTRIPDNLKKKKRCHSEDVCSLVHIGIAICSRGMFEIVAS